MHINEDNRCNKVCSLCMSQAWEYTGGCDSTCVRKSGIGLNDILYIKCMVLLKYVHVFKYSELLGPLLPELMSYGYLYIERY